MGKNKISNDNFAPSVPLRLYEKFFILPLFTYLKKKFF